MSKQSEFERGRAEALRMIEQQGLDFAQRHAERLEMSSAYDSGFMSVIVESENE